MARKSDDQLHLSGTEPLRSDSIYIYIYIYIEELSLLTVCATFGGVAISVKNIHTRRLLLGV